MAVIKGSGYIVGTDGNDSITGSPGVDGIDGGLGADTLTGADGNDTYYVDNIGDVIIESAQGGHDTLVTPLNAYQIANNVEVLVFSGTGNFTGYGNGGDNTIAGGNSNDTLIGGGGFDHLSGGLGDDYYVMDGNGDLSIEEYINGGVDTVVFDTGSRVNLNKYTYVEIGIYSSMGSALLTGNDLNNLLMADDGHDTLNGGNGGIDTLSGGGGDDTYMVSEGDIVIEGERLGTDTVLSFVSNYTLGDNVENLTLVIGGNGTGNEFDNVIEGDNGNNILNGRAGVDTISGNVGSDTINGDEGNDLLYGGDGADLVKGGTGNDTLIGGFGDDKLYGDDGYDFLEIDSPRADFIVSKNGDGSITIKDTWAFDGDFGTDTVYGIEAVHFSDGIVTAEALLPQHPQPPETPPRRDFTGTNGNNILTGNAIANVLKGLGGNDVLRGLNGSDKLYGGFGNDTLYGGAGADKFVFNTKPNAKFNKDAIKDFRVVDDMIWLENAVFTNVGRGGALKASAFFVNKTGVAHDASDRIIYDKDSGILYYDADGTGRAAGVAFATISKNLSVTYKDFLVV